MLENNVKHNRLYEHKWHILTTQKVTNIVYKGRVFRKATTKG